jgi:hypothetical protein
VERVFLDRALLARAGTILGPYENVGRLTWWLARMARGGEILCPGPADLEIQYIDARDLANFVIDASTAGHSGPFNVVSHRGHATMGSLLEACHQAAGPNDAVMTWVDPETIATAGIEPWTELPIWIPPGHEYSGMHDANVDRAYRAGLHCRPVTETVLDAWQSGGRRRQPPCDGDPEAIRNRSRGPGFRARRAVIGHGVPGCASGVQGKTVASRFAGGVRGDYAAGIPGS